MKTLLERMTHVENTRWKVVEYLDAIDEARGAVKPAPERWSIQENAEHLVLAEEVGILFVWRAIQNEWDGEHPHRGLSIEEVVEATWKEKEIAPQPATPRFGGPLAYWRERLRNGAGLLEQLGRALHGRDLETLIYPHVLSGPLDAGQRIDFLAFHMERHLAQMKATG